MPKKTQIKEPTKWEDVAGIGPKRASDLRNEVGDYNEWKKNSSNYKRNTISKAHTSRSSDPPKFVRNAIDASSRRSRTADVVDSDLVTQQQVDQRTARTKSKTSAREKNKRGDRSGLGFETQERDRFEFGGAFDVLRDEYDDRFDVPAADLGRKAMDEVDGANSGEVTAQPLIGAASSRVTFGRRAQPEDFKSEIESAAKNTDRATASPGELADAFTSFVEDEVGFGQQRGDFTIQAPDSRRAESIHNKRSAASRRVDNNRRAEITTDVDKWASQPESYDYPGVDTPSAQPEVRDNSNGMFQL